MSLPCFTGIAKSNAYNINEWCGLGVVVTMGECRLTVAQPSNFSREARIKTLKKQTNKQKTTSVFLCVCVVTKSLLSCTPIQVICIHLYQINNMKVLVDDMWSHTGTAQSASYTFSRVYSLHVLMDEETKAQRDWITYLSLYNLEPRFDLKSDTRAYALNSYPISAACMPTTWTPAVPWLVQSLAVSGNSVKVGCVNFVLMKSDSHHYAFINTAFSSWNIFHS